jgi:hypothetical protein
MSKFFKKCTRKFHRWLVIPFVIVLFVVLFNHDTQIGMIAQRVQQILMLTLAISGMYMYLLPSWTKWRRNQRRKT